MIIKCHIIIICEYSERLVLSTFIEKKKTNIQSGGEFFSSQMLLTGRNLQIKYKNKNKKYNKVYKTSVDKKTNFSI